MDKLEMLEIWINKEISKIDKFMSAKDLDKQSMMINTVIRGAYLNVFSVIQDLKEMEE